MYKYHVYFFLLTRDSNSGSTGNDAKWWTITLSFAKKPNENKIRNKAADLFHELYPNDSFDCMMLRVVPVIHKKSDDMPIYC